MQLFDSRGPNPYTTRLFALERGANIDIIATDIFSMKHHEPPYVTEVNTRGELPALITDAGTVITEITAICEYLDEITEGTSLMGTTAQDRALTRMWTRRVYLGICHPAVEWWRGTTDAANFYQGNRILFPESQATFRQQTEHHLDLLENDLKDRDYIAGDTYSLADTILYAFMACMSVDGGMKWLHNPKRKNITAWYDRIAARPASQMAATPLAAGPINKAA